MRSSDQSELPIGVLADPAQRSIVQELFELLKIDWEWFRAGTRYAAILSFSGEVPSEGCPLLILVSGRPLAWDEAHGIQCNHQSDRAAVLVWEERRIHLHSAAIGFGGAGTPLLRYEVTERVAAVVLRIQDRLVLRLGYSLDQEALHLLTAGQSVEQAAIPTLDLHVHLIRKLLTSAGISLAELSPNPYGFAYTACLTHDIDHPSIRRHGFDHTTIGFLKRASIDSTLQVLTGRTSITKATRNLTACLKLPFIKLGLAQDFWLDFEHYPQWEKNVGSTFFVIPFRGVSGRALNGAENAPFKRAAAYGARDLSPQLQRLRSAGSEIALHGIDAWNCVESAKHEADEIHDFVSGIEKGVRMHWLYFSRDAHQVLEQAGFTYDSTCGYNQTVGFKNGTSQIFKPLSTSRLLELPLHIMDTALFYPSYLNLTDEGGLKQITPILEAAKRHGGTVTVNWHDRSLFPERQWGEFYLRLIKQLHESRAWFATASQAIAWARTRRAFEFKTRKRGSATGALGQRQPPSSLPFLTLRQHQPSTSLWQTTPFIDEQDRYVDTPLSPAG